MSKGSILIYTSAAGQAAPLPGVSLTVTDAGGSVRARLVTELKLHWTAGSPLF